MKMARQQLYLDDLKQNLSKLGENLAKRIDLEDRLRALMLHNVMF